MEIVRERLEREFDLSLIATAPSVEYRCDRTAARSVVVDNPSEMPPAGEIERIEEPFLTTTFLTPDRLHGHADGAVPDAAGRDGEARVPVARAASSSSTGCRWPRWSIDFFDQLKSRTQGYASLDYEPAGYDQSNLVKVDILLNGVPVDAFSTIVHRDKAYDYGRRMSEKLRELIPRQMFDVPIQAAIGGRIIARETVKAKRKDVLAKCYGGDITRKRKLLEKQKEGKKRMKNIGRVEVPQEAFIAALRLDD